MQNYTEYMMQMKVDGEWKSGCTHRGVPMPRRRNREDMERVAVDVASMWEQERRWRDRNCKPTDKFPTDFRIVEREVTVSDWRLSE